MYKRRLDHVQKNCEACSKVTFSAQKVFVAKNIMSDVKQDAQKFRIHPFLKSFIGTVTNCFDCFISTFLVNTQIENGDKHCHGTSMHKKWILNISKLKL